MTGEVATLLRQGNIEKAVSRAKQIAESENTGESYSDLTYAFLGARNVEAALEAATSAVRSNPREPAFRFLRARIEFMHGNAARAFHDAQRSVKYSEELHNEYYVASSQLLAAASLVKLSRLQDARAILERVNEDVQVFAGELITRASVMNSLRGLRTRFDAGLA